MGARVEIVASERHYADHLLPLVLAIEGAQFRTSDERIADRARALGVEPERWSHLPYGPPVIVAAHKDMNRVHADRKLAVLEHGAGQGYQELADHAGWAGGEAWARASLVMAPGPHAGRRWTGAFPDTTVVELGGSPRLDSFVPRHPPLVASEKPTVAFSFHWDCKLVPEARATWRYWMPAIRDLAYSEQYRLIGHGHPRAWEHLVPLWRRMKMLPCPDFADVLARADLYVCDNSSTMYEFAALGGKVLCLDWLDEFHYREWIDHGLRFWTHPPGLRVSDPAKLSDAIAVALADESPLPELRRLAVEEAYGGPFDGRATERAVDAIEAWLG